MIGMHFRLDMNPIDDIIKNHRLEPGGEVQKYVDSEVLRLSEPYVPKLSGVLSGSGMSSTILGSGEVKWNTPYARYQYYGKVMVGPAPKTVTSTPLKYHGGGARGAKWFERMKAAHVKEIINGAAAMCGGHS